MWEEMVIHFALGLVKMLVKNPAKAAALQTYLIELRDAITLLYPGS